MEKTIETLMLRSRWLLAPVYLGLSLALIALMIKFFQEVWHLFSHIFSATEAEVVLVVLSLIDISLVGGLLVMVMMSGYENFVSELDSKGEGEGSSRVAGGLSVVVVLAGRGVQESRAAAGARV